MIAVHHNDKARFLALQEIFNHDARACIAHFIAQQHIVDSGMGFIQSHSDNHAFTGSQTIRLNNNRRTFLVAVIMCRIGIFKSLVLRGWNLIFCHKCFSKILWALQLGRVLSRAKNLQSGSTEVIHHTRSQRRFRADYCKSNIFIPAKINQILMRR